MSIPSTIDILLSSGGLSESYGWVSRSRLVWVRVVKGLVKEGRMEGGEQGGKEKERESEREHQKMSKRNLCLEFLRFDHNNKYK